MRFGTKILLLTLAVTLGLGGLVLWVVGREVRGSEAARAQVDIARDVEDYFDRLTREHRNIGGAARRLMEDSEVRAEMELDEITARLRPAAEVQFESNWFPIDLQQELSRGDGGDTSGPAPAFHLLLGPRGQVLAVSGANASLAKTLRDAPADWRWSELLSGRSLVRQYVVVSGELYIAFGVAIRLSMSDAPERAYFAGFRVDDAWLRGHLVGASRASAGMLWAWFSTGDEVLVGQAPPGMTDVARERASTGPVDGAHAPVEFTVGGETFIGERLEFSLGRAGPGSLTIASSLDAELRPRLTALYRAIGLSTLAVVAVALVAARWLARVLAQPVEQLDAAARDIARGDFSRSVPVTRTDELGRLAASFNAMAKGLAQRDLIKDTFGKFVSPQVVEQFIADPSRLRLGGERRVQTILFADLAGFTASVERLAPDALLRLLNDYLQSTSDAVERQHGIVDKFVGDGVLAFFGPPVEADHAIKACRAALEIAGTPNDHGTRRPVRVGIATGEVLVGNVGSRSKYNYTVIGDAVNLASRLQSANKTYGTRVLATKATAEAAGDRIVARVIDIVRVAGRAEPVELHEIMCERGRIADQIDARCHAYEEALRHYAARDFRRAGELFGALANDPAAIAMRDRCLKLVFNPPDVSWDGVFAIEAK